MKCKHCNSQDTIKDGIKSKENSYTQTMKCNACGERFILNDHNISKTAIVTPDKHFPLADSPAINVLCQAIELIKPDIYIDLGDIGEWSHFSRWKYKGKERPPLEYMIDDCNTDIIDVNMGMDIIDESLDKVDCKERYMCEGNHDDWLNSFTERYPYVDYRFKDAVNLDSRGYKYYPMGMHLKIGHLYFYHGHSYGGMYHASNHLRKLGCNVMYGHWHDLQHITATHMDGPKAAWSIGCLKDMSSESNAWLKNRKINWAHAFAIVDFYGEEGYFTVNIVQIINGRTSIWGNLIDGNDYKVSGKAFEAKDRESYFARSDRNDQTFTKIHV